MRVYLIDLDGDLHDLRGQKAAQPLIYHNDNYLVRTLREAESNGIAYDSLRRTDGEYVAVFRPPLLSNARQERHLCYVWNGQRVETVYEKREIGVSGSNAARGFQLDELAKFHGSRSSMRSLGWPAAMASRVALSQA